MKQMFLRVALLIAALLIAAPADALIRVKSTGTVGVDCEALTVQAALALATNGETIRIEDSATYSAAYTVPLTISSGAATTLTITNAAGTTPVINKSGGTNQLFRFQPAGGAFGTLTIQAADANSTITLRNSFTTAPCLATGTAVDTTHRVVLDTVVLESIGAASGLINCNNAGNHSLTRVKLVGPNMTTGAGAALGNISTIISGASITATDCTFGNAGTGPAVNLQAKPGSSVTMNNCTFAPTGNGFPLQTVDGGSLVLNDCVIRPNGSGLLAISAAGNPTITINRPNITQGTFGGFLIAFLYQTFPASITVNGTSAANKLDLNPLVSNGALRIARMLQGTLTLNNCSLSSGGPSNMLVDCSDGVNNLLGTVAINLNGCDFRNSAGYIAPAALGGAFPVNITATNTIWSGSDPVVFPDLLNLNGNNTAAGTIALNHCTLFKNPGAVLVNAQTDSAGAPDAGPVDQLLANYTIFDGGVIGATAATVTPSGSVVLQGDQNLVQPGTLGGFGFPGIAPASTVAGASNVDIVTGRLTATSFAAFGNATLSTEVSDIDGNTRSAIGNVLNDIGASETSNVPVELATFVAE